jgi:protein SCO1/2
MRRTFVAAVALMVWPILGLAHDDPHEGRLPAIGPAPSFALVSQDGERVSLRDYRGKVVALTFIFTTCADTCPLLTAKMAAVQDELGPLFGSSIAFVSITVDPLNDTPAVLKRYAAAFGADPAGWAFLTGDVAAIYDVAQRYGVFAAQAPSGSVEHTFLTSLIDASGTLRVQYLGTRFDPDEFRHDLLSLANESD